MINNRRYAKLFLLAFYFGLCTGVFAEKGDKKAPVTIEDALTWKSTGVTALSKDGEWFASHFGQVNGDREIIIRHTSSDKSYTFPIGETPRFASGAIAFSDDGRWAAFTVYPTKKEKKALKKGKKKAQNKMALLNLKSGEKTEFKKIRSFRFSGKNAGWIAMHKYTGKNQQGKGKWKGADLILREMHSAKSYNIGNVASFDFNESGAWLAWTIDAEGRDGNGVQAREMATNRVHILDSDTANYKKLTWTEEGDALAFLKGKKAEGYESQLFSVMGFIGFGRGELKGHTFNPAAYDGFPANMTISPNRMPVWTVDRKSLLFGIHDLKKAKEKKKTGAKKKAKKEKSSAEGNAEKAVKGDTKAKPQKSEKTKKPDKDEMAGLVIWHWKDKRLQSQQQVMESRDKNFSYLSVYHINSEKFLRLADDELRNVSAASAHRWATGTDNRKYEWLSGLDGRRYKDIYAIDLSTGERKLVVERNRWSYGASPDGTHLLYYDDGHFYTFDYKSNRKYNISEGAATSFVNTEDDHNVAKPPIRPFGWTADSKYVLLSDGWDVWKLSVHGDKATNLTQNGKTDQIRYQRRFRLDPKEKGIDLSRSVYFSAYGEWTKKAGIGRIKKGRASIEMLSWDDAVFSRLSKAENADVYVYSRETASEAPEYYRAGPDLKAGRKMTDVGSQQKKFKWSAGGKLIEYTSAKGKKLQAALYLPADYKEGTAYPTVVYIYEKLSRGFNRYYTPRDGGFNKSIYTSQGYAVLMPDITYEINDPGMSAVWCVVPAVEAAIATGVVDRSNVAIHGHSWGGYQTAFLITQTKLFKAAIAGAPLTNMISMYSSVYWNSGRPNQPIFESSQGRFEGGYLQNLEAYARNSPVYFADKVSTPLLLLHNDKDGAVDWNQGIEYFNTLRRLGKPVVMLQYKGENHGVRKPANRRDYSYRMKEFLDHHLKNAAASEWLDSGVSHLKHKEHLEKRAVKKTKQKKKTTQKKEKK